MIKNPAKTRPLVKLGRITELFQGNDGNIRSARIIRRDASGENQNILQLFPVELSLTHNVKRCSMPESPIKSQKTSSLTSRKTKRKIKKKCSKELLSVKQRGIKYYMGFQGKLCSRLLSDSILGYSIFTPRCLAGLTSWI